MSTGLFIDPIFLEHKTGFHPESPSRFHAIQSRMEHIQALSDFEVFPSRMAELKEIELVHDLEYVYKIEAAIFRGQRHFGSEDCSISERSFEVARHAVGAVLDAVLLVGENRLDNAFCAIRPPGHHAEVNQCLGFCFFNNVAVAAEFLTRELGFRKVLVFDFDVHHGNGIQNIFYDRSDVYYVSIHQDPATCFPGTGLADERGNGDGLGYTLNRPMKVHSGNEHYVHEFNQHIWPRLLEYKPDFILISAGFDAHQDDPLANINLTEIAFSYMTLQLKKLAERYSGGRLVSVLEGGYNLRVLADCVTRHLINLREGTSLAKPVTLPQQLQQWVAGRWLKYNPFQPFNFNL